MGNKALILYPCKKKLSKIRILVNDILILLVLFFIMNMSMWLIFDAMAKAVK